MNAPNTHETFYLQQGEKKVRFEKDTKVPNAATFFINKEDHTLGNLLATCVCLAPQPPFEPIRGTPIEAPARATTHRMCPNLPLSLFPVNPETPPTWLW